MISCIICSVANDFIPVLDGGVSTSPGRSVVLEWQVVTVALFHSSRSCIGAPTILLRPTTTAFFPATDTPVERRWIHYFWTYSIVCRIFSWPRLFVLFKGVHEVVFTGLSDQLHAAVWCAGDEAVAQVPA